MKRWNLRSLFWAVSASLVGNVGCDNDTSPNDGATGSESESASDDDDDDATAGDDDDDAGSDETASGGDDDDDHPDDSSTSAQDSGGDSSGGDDDDDHPTDDDDDHSTGDDDDDSTSSSGDDETSSDTSDDVAVNICDETVPSDLYLDGIPSYSQCDKSMDSAIWSSDGISTATEQLGSDWQRTQWGAGYQCTEYATRYMLFKWGVMQTPNGNAGEWCDGDAPEGMVKTMMPVHGDLMVFAGGSCGAGQETGHVAVVDIVHDDEQSAEFVEQNGANRRTCKIDTAACFLHAVANE